MGMLAIFPPLVLSAQDVRKDLEAERARARTLKGEMEKTREELQKVLRQEKQVMTYLDSTERELDRYRKANREIRGSLLKAQEALNEAKTRYEDLESDSKALEVDFHRRLFAMYRAQKAGYPAMILSAETPQDGFRRYYYLLSVLREDARHLGELQSKIIQWKRAEESYELRKEELLQLQKSNLSQQRKIRTQKDKKQRLLIALKSREELQTHALKELEETSAQLKALIKSLKEAARHEARPDIPSVAGTGFAKRKGRLPFPVRGLVRTHFGKQLHPLFKTYTVNNGIEIESQEGEEIKAVHPGTVVFSGWLRGYGNVLIIDHGGGYYSLSGHASRLLKNVGDRVRGLESIGYVGESGSLSGPSLYFEIRKGEKPVDPLVWINAKAARVGRK